MAAMLRSGSGAIGALRSVTDRKHRAWIDHAELHSSFRSCDPAAPSDAADPEAWRPSMGLSGRDVAPLPSMQHADGAAGATSAPRPSVRLRRFTLGASHVSMHDGWLQHMDL